MPRRSRGAPWSTWRRTRPPSARATATRRTTASCERLGPGERAREVDGAGRVVERAGEGVLVDVDVHEAELRGVLVERRVAAVHELGAGRAGAGHDHLGAAQ